MGDASPESKPHGTQKDVLDIVNKTYDIIKAHIDSGEDRSTWIRYRESGGTQILDPKLLKLENKFWKLTWFNDNLKMDEETLDKVQDDYRWAIINASLGRYDWFERGFKAAKKTLTGGLADPFEPYEKILKEAKAPHAYIDDAYEDFAGIVVGGGNIKEESKRVIDSFKKKGFRVRGEPGEDFVSIMVYPPKANPELTKDRIEAALSKMIIAQFGISRARFDRIWGEIDRTGIIDKLIAKKRVTDDSTGLEGKSLEELEGMVSDDLAKNNMIALEMVKKPNFNRELVNGIYNGLGVQVHLGKEGTYGKGIQLKRKLNLQQFYTSSAVSKVMKEVLAINPMARIFDPTCGSGRLFFHMPNPELCHGVEIEGNAYSIARAMYPKARIIQDSAMHHIHENEFDYVLANPPFTLFWEDKMRIFHHTGYNNRIVSEIAIMEAAIRSLRNGGYLAIVMPIDVMITKFIDKIKFLDWLKDAVDAVAKINLPTTTHEGTTWPVALFIFRKSDTYTQGWPYSEKSKLPDWQFTHQLKSFDEPELQNLIKEFKASDAFNNVVRFATDIPNQGPFDLKIEKPEEFLQTEYLKTATNIVSTDIVTLNANLAEIDSFILPPLNLVPNGLHADLKINAIRSIYGMQWSPSRKAYVDMFREKVATLDGFLDERKKYDNLPLVNGLHSYDCQIEHSPGFVDALSKRKEWIDFQNTPLEIWVDQDQDFNWEEMFEGQGYKDTYPDIWAKWEAKFIELQKDPTYNVFLPHIQQKDNWIKHLFTFQKEDAMRMAMKASIINASSMGLGKTRTSIATALLKGFPNNVIVCQTRLINTWMEEFEGLGLPTPHLVEYKDDLKDMMEHLFVIVSYETLRSQKGKKRPKGKRRSNPGRDPEFSYDIPSVFETEEKMADLFSEFGFSGETAIDVGPLTDEIRSNPRKAKEGEETKTQEKIRKLQTMPLFADNFTEKFDFMIVDEAHNLSNPTTLQTQAVWRLKPKHLNFLSGTPIKNRVKGLLSLLIIGWGEDTTAMPYTKASFLEHFMQEIEVEYETADAHGYITKAKKTVEIPQIANPDDLRSLMAGKLLRRTQYEPEVAADRKFPKPEINYIPIEPSDAEKVYSRQWYDELLRLKQEIMEAKEKLKSLRESRKSGWGWNEDGEDELSELEQELRVKVAICVIMINKLRAVALAPQIDWLGNKTEDDETEEKHKSALMRIINIADPYRGGRTPRQHQVVDELVRRVKLGEQCYTIVDFPAFNRKLLKPWLEEKGIKVEVIDGGVSKKRRNEIINQFREQKIDVLCATIGTFDVGINIPAASYCCIIMPSWNFSDMSQAFHRMIRPQSEGERTVDIFYIKNSIDTYVKELSDMKRWNMEYVIDYGPRPPEQEWFSWSDAVNSMFLDLQRGDFSV